MKATLVFQLLIRVTDVERASKSELICVYRRFKTISN